jgi:hypothetical protein
MHIFYLNDLNIIYFFINILLKTYNTEIESLSFKTEVLDFKIGNFGKNEGNV